jgi:uncharacterized membrane protein
MESEKIKNQPLSRRILYWMSAQGHWDGAKMQELFERGGIYPSRRQMAFWLDKALLAAGALLTVCGVIFFFAYNWADMHRFAKLGLVASGILATGVFTFFQKEGSAPFQIGLFALVGLTGSIFALFGQTYQTGANAYDFFFGWTALATLWVAISRFPALWLFYLVLINVTVALYAVQVHLWQSGSALLLTLGSINLLAWLIWERLHLKNTPLFEARWWPRIVGMATILMLSILGTEALFSDFDKFAYMAGLPLFLLLSAGIYFIYSQSLKDLSLLAACGLANMVFVNALIIKSLMNGMGSDTDTLILAFLLCSLFSVLGSIYGVKMLIQLNKSWKIQSVS